MRLSADACGVIATVIPVYLLVLVSGRQRLMRPYGTGVAARIVDLQAAFVAIVGTMAEIAALTGVLLGGIVGAGAALISFGALLPAALTGSTIVLYIFKPNPNSA